MPRLPIIDPATSTGPAKEAFDGPLKGKHLNIFKGMANSPSGLAAYLGINQALALGSITDQEKEAIALVTGETNDCDYCIAAHTAIGKMVGLSEDQTVAIRKGDSTGDAKLDALVTFTRAVNERRGFVGDDDLASFKAGGYSDASVVEVLIAYSLNVYTNFFNHVNETEVDFPAPPVLA